jgi:hypothetical protein
MMSLLSFPAHEIRDPSQIDLEPDPAQSISLTISSSIFDFWLKADFVSIFVRENIVVLWYL